MVYQGFIWGSNVNESRIADCERTINFYVERNSAPGAKAQSMLFPMPGLTTFVTVAQGPVRALASQQGRCFAVVGFKLYEIFANGTATDRGDVAFDSNPATISWNGHGANQLFITSGREGYCYDLDTNDLTAVVANVDAGVYVDGYFLGLDAQQSILKRSDLEDGLTWSALNVQQRQTASDNWTGIATKNREIWLVGSQTSDVYVGTGNFLLPFAPIPQGLVQMGTPAGFSPAVLSDIGSLVWIGGNGQGGPTIVGTTGYQTQRLSTHAVDDALQSYGDLSGAISYAYQVQGHNFVLVNIPSANATWVYDVTTGLWTERLLWNRAQGVWNAHRGSCHAYAFGRHLIGDRSTGTIYDETDTDTSFLDADGLGMRRLRTATHLANEGKNVTYDRLRLDMQTGIGLATGQGSDPQVMLRYSDDGGWTWSAELWASAGKIGTYNTMVEWRRLGAGRDRVFEVTMSDPVPWRINGAWLDLRMGKN